jgi:hypothetical protein
MVLVCWCVGVGFSGRAVVVIAAVGVGVLTPHPLHLRITLAFGQAERVEEAQWREDTGRVVHAEG